MLSERSSGDDAQQLVSIVMEMPENDPALDALMWTIFGCMELNGGEVLAVGIQEVKG